MLFARLGRANLTGLVLGCIEAKFCNKICVGKLSPRSTQCTPLHSSVISFFCQHFAKFLQDFANFYKISKISENFRKFWKNSSNFLKKCDFKAVQRSALCRSQRELSNAYLLANFGFDDDDDESLPVIVSIWPCTY